MGGGWGGGVGGGGGGGYNILAQGLKEGFLHPPSGLLMTGLPAVLSLPHTHTSTLQFICVRVCAQYLR